MHDSPSPAPTTLRVRLGAWHVNHPAYGPLRVRAVGPHETLGDLGPFGRATNPEGWRALDTFAARLVLWASPAGAAREQVREARALVGAGSGDDACRISSAEVLALAGGAPSTLRAALPADALHVVWLRRGAADVEDFVAGLRPALLALATLSAAGVLVVQVQQNGIVRGELEVTP